MIYQISNISNKKRWKKINVLSKQQNQVKHFE